MDQKINWKEMFTNSLSQQDFAPSEITTIYTIEMELRSFFDFDGVVPRHFRLQNIERDKKEIFYYWESASKEASCPHCTTVSTHAVGDYYDRCIQDVPQSEKAVYHIVHSKRYFCHNETCTFDRFIERFYDFTDENARKTRRFKEYCITRSLSCGCFQAQREIRAEGACVSNDSIGRYLKAKAATVIESNITQDDVRVLAIDDVNLRKGDKSSGCTVFIDQEKHKVLIIVRGTTKEAAKRVMEKFPSSKFLSRDRATAYASAGSDLGKIQVADRFHLIQNAQAAVKDALMANVQAHILIREGDGWVQVTPDTHSNEKSYFHVPDQTIEERIKLAGLSPKKAEKYRNTLKLLELADKGFRTADIAKEMDIPYKSVQALRRSAASTMTEVEDRINSRSTKPDDIEPAPIQSPGEQATQTVAGPRIEPASQSIVEPYRETVIEMWKAGGNHRSIYPVIQSQGYTGSKNAIYQYIVKLGKELPSDMIRERKQKTSRRKLEEDFDLAKAQDRPELSLESIARHNVYKSVLKEASNKRPKEIDKKSKSHKPKTPHSRPASSCTSPYSKEVLDLIYGPDKEQGNKLEKTKSPKKKL